MRIVLIFLIFISCERKPVNLDNFVEDNEQPIEVINDLEIKHNKNGLLKIKIIASKIHRYQFKEPSLIFSDNFTVYFYNDSLKVESILQAEEATLNEKKKIMKAFKNVVLTSSKQQKLETEELIWDEKKNIIFTEREVKITNQEEIIYGKGFISNPSFTKYSIDKIHGSFDFKN